MHRRATLVKIDATDEDPAGVKAEESPTIGHFPKGTNEALDSTRADLAPAEALRGYTPLKHPSPGVPPHSVDALDRVDEVGLTTTKADRLSNLKSEHSRKIGNKENGAKLRNDLERDPPGQLDLVTARTGQHALKATAQILSLSAERAAESTMAGTSRYQAPNPGERLEPARNRTTP